MLIEGIRNVSTSYAPAAAPAAAQVDSTPLEAPRSAQLPYLSPVVQYDSDAAVAILLFRDGDSGDVETQYPSKRVVREYQLRGREGAVGETPLPATREEVAVPASSGISASATPGGSTTGGSGGGVAAVVSAAVSAPAPAASTGSGSGGGGIAVNLVA